MNQVVDGVYRLGSVYVNFYVIDEGGHLTLIDAGLAGYAPQVPDLLRSLGRSWTDVEAVVLTHTHTDHLGLVRDAAAAGARIFVPAGERKILTGTAKAPRPKGAAKVLTSADAIKMVAHLMRNGAAKQPAVDEAEAYADDAVLDVPGKPRAIATPGHSPDHHSLWLEERALLFSGDALVTRGLSRRRGPQLMTLNVDAERARRSLERLASISADVMLPGHGKPWRDGVSAAVERAGQA